MNRFEMFDAMISRKIVTLSMRGLHYTGLINAIEMEDGSGHNFNVTIFLIDGHSSHKIFVKG